MTSENNLREYVVTLHRFDDLESFYADMETEGEDLYIPNRTVDCYLRRPVSRNTHYMLTDQEAEQLRQDPRVLAVDLTPEQLGIEITPLWTQTSTKWSKSTTLAQGQLNWGLLRINEGLTRPNWGSNATAEVTGTITVPFSGKNVDVVIMDGRLEINHPEFAKNIDGTGGSRIIQENWYALNPTVTGGAASTYSYTPADSASDWHGTFCAGIVAGNTQGWARDANIYNIYVYGVEPKVPPAYQFDYIKTWHLAKSINPATGQKNPTIINASFGRTITKFLYQLTSITYRGVTYPRPSSGSFTAAEARSYGLDVYGTAPYEYVGFPYRYVAEEADIADCIAAGIIVVAAAGNDSTKVELPGGIDYDNTVTIDEFLTSQVPYHQGTTPGSAPGVISVGAVGTSYNVSGEEKADYSNCGPGVPIFAPGSNIRSSINNNYTLSSVADTRNSSFKITKSSGTSFASPQVAGMLATLLEVTPTLTPADALSYITSNAKTGQLYSSNNLDYYDLQGAPNRYAFIQYPTTITITPNTTKVTPTQTVEYTITLPNVADGSLIYLTESGTSTSTDFDDGATQFSLTIYNGTATLTRAVRTGVTGSRTSILQLRTGGYNGNIQATASTVTVSVGDFATSSGSFTVDAQGKGSFTITPSLDSATEGAETFTVSIRTGSVSGNAVKTSNPITINDA